MGVTSKYILGLSLCFLLLSEAVTNAAVTNAWWQLNGTTGSTATQPIAANVTNNAINTAFGWVPAGSLTVTYVTHTGSGNAINFGYSGNQSGRLNGSTITSSTTISGLGAYTTFTNIQISYEALWNGDANMTSTLAYSLNGGTYQNFKTDTIVNGSVWTTYLSNVTTTLALNNGDTISIRATLTGASGNSKNLAFDNVMILGNVVAVPEPQTLTLAALAAAMALGLKIRRRR